MHLPLHDSETNSEMDHECQRTAKQAQEEMQETIKHALHTLHTLFIQNEANVYRIPSISIVITSISQSPNSITIWLITMARLLLGWEVSRTIWRLA
jgi:hypothetical protein